ncbi:hypothetical protein KCU89_g57, partial [Aureobasidium melanogenum]
MRFSVLSITMRVSECGRLRVPADFRSLLVPSTLRRCDDLAWASAPPSSFALLRFLILLRLPLFLLQNGTYGPLMLSAMVFLAELAPFLNT